MFLKETFGGNQITNFEGNKTTYRSHQALKAKYFMSPHVIPESITVIHFSKFENRCVKRFHLVKNKRNSSKTFQSLFSKSFYNWANELKRIKPMNKIIKDSVRIIEDLNEFHTKDEMEVLFENSTKTNCILIYFI